MMALPPSLAGMVQLTVACPSLATAVPMVGAPGAVAAGLTPLEAADSAPGPKLLVACTVKV